VLLVVVEAVFEIVSQFNRSAALVTSPDEREQVAQLNLVAGKRAKNAAAYSSALSYFAEGRRLLAFVADGGRLVIGGSDSQGTLPAVIPRPPRWSSSAATSELPSPGAGAIVAGVSEVRSAGEGEWSVTAGYRAALRDGAGGSLLLERTIGRGTIELLADASPLQNRLLDVADNAQFGLDLIGPRVRPVVFVESVHGFGERIGLAALPSRWWLAFALLALAGLLWILARGRRLGPSEPAGAPAPPPRSAYVEAISLLLERTDEHEVSAALTRLRDGR